MIKVYVQITVETEERADRWACRSPEFGFIVYGKTREAARGEVNKALNALLSSFHGDIEAIDRFLKQRQVPYYDIQRGHRNEPGGVESPEAVFRGSCTLRRSDPATEVSLEEILIA